MNRTIKFRGKRCKDGEWVYGSYVESNTSWNKGKPHKSWILPSPMTNGGWFSIRGAYPVIDETVGQFTGHKDCNGKEVYEGDILETNKGLVALVTFDKADVFMLGDEDPDFMFSFSKMEIIGNIYDNPELLKGGDND